MPAVGRLRQFPHRATNSESTRRRLGLAQLHGSLRPFHTAHYDTLEESLRDAVAQRTSTDVDEDMFPWLVAGVAVSAYKSATRLWARNRRHTEMLPQLIQIAFDQISDACDGRDHQVTSPSLTIPSSPAA